MAQKDLFQRLFMSRPDMYADVCNTFFPWRAVEPSALMPADPNVVFKGLDRKIRLAMRDALKIWISAKATLAILGIESQTAFDWNMVVRVLLYDALTYKSQSRKRKEKLRPVITFVVYYGEKPWTGPTTLRECVEFVDGTEPLLLPLFNDFRLNILDFHTIPFEKIEAMTSDFRYIATFFYNASHPNDQRPFPSVKDTEIIQEFLDLFRGKKRGNKYPKINISDEKLAQGGYGMNELLNNFVDYQVKAQVKAQVNAQVNERLGVAIAEATENVTKKVTEDVTQKVTKEVTNKVREEARLAWNQRQKRSAFNLWNQGFSSDKIAEIIGEPQAKIDLWLDEER